MMADGFKEWEDKWFLENAPEIEMMKDVYRKSIMYKADELAYSFTKMFEEIGKGLTNKKESNGEEW